MMPFSFWIESQSSCSSTLCFANRTELARHSLWDSHFVDAGLFSQVRILPNFIHHMWFGTAADAGADRPQGLAATMFGPNQVRERLIHFRCLPLCAPLPFSASHTLHRSPQQVESPVGQGGPHPGRVVITAATDYPFDHGNITFSIHVVNGSSSSQGSSARCSPPKPRSSPPKPAKPTSLGVLCEPVC